MDIVKQFAVVLAAYLYLGTVVPVFAAISFEISNPVQEGDYYIVDTTLSGISSDSAYLQGMFTAEGATSYFGFTWGKKGEWVKYDGSVSKEYILENFTVIQKDQNTKIWVKPDFTHTAYKGPGNYLLKLKRYTGNSDGSAGDSNTLSIQLSEPTPTPTATSTPTQAPTPTTSPTTTSTPTPTPAKISTPTPTVFQKSSSPSPNLKITPTITSTLTTTPSATVTTSLLVVDVESVGEVKGEATSSADSTISKKPFLSDKNIFLIGLIIFSFSGGLLYFRLTNH